MTTNLSSRNVRLIIGSQDWSNWIEADSGIQVGYPEYQAGSNSAVASGLKPVEGTITLEFSIYDPNLPSSPNYLLNPSQWQREQTLSIEVANDEGALEFLPCSGQTLYILKAPQQPKRSLTGLQQITFSIGCRLLLENFPPEPNKDVSNVVAGTFLNRGQIIGNILSFIGVPNAIGSIPYDIDYPLPKIQGNWIQMCGELASTAGYYLRCDATGFVIAELIDLINTGAVRNYVIGRDEEIWEPSGDSSDQPVEKLIISGVKPVVTPVDTDPQIKEETESLAKSYPDIYGSLATFNNSIETFRITAKSFKKINDTLFEEKIEIRESLAKSYPDIFGVSGSFLRSVDPLSENTTQYFLENGICYKTVFIEREALAKLYPDIYGVAGAAFNASLDTKRITTKTWVKVRDGLWNLTTKIEEPRGVTYPDIFAVSGNFSSLIETVSENTVPDTTGAPTNFGDLGESSIKEEPIKAEVFSQQIVATKNRDRQNTLNIPYAVSTNQLQAYGENYNRFLSGRAIGFLFVGKFDFLTPFNQVSVIDGDVAYFMRVDGLQWAINQQKATLGWYGIINGFANTETPDEIVFPVEISLGEFIMTTKFNIYGVFDEPLTSQAITQFNIYAIPTINWGILETQFDIYAINDTITSIYKAYWALEDIVSGVTINELGNTDYDLTVSSGSVTTGKVDNCIFDLSASLPNSVPDPFFDLNANNFVGFALWLFPEISGSGQIDVVINGVIFASWKLTIDFDIAEIILQAQQSGFGLVPVSTSITIDDWNLVICEIDKIAETITIKVNNGTKQLTSAPITGQSSVLPLTVQSTPSRLDEFFFYSEPLNTSQESAIWNSGSGSVYPPF